MNDLDLCLEVMFTIASHSQLNISETVRDRGLVPKDTNRNGVRGIEWSRDQWRHVTPKGQGRDHNTLGAQYLEKQLELLFCNDRYNY